MSIEISNGKYGLTPEKHNAAKAVLGALGPIVLDGGHSDMDRRSVLPRNLTLREMHRRTGVSPTDTEYVINGPQCLDQKTHTYVRRTVFEDKTGRLWEIIVKPGPRNNGIKKAQKIASRNQTKDGGTIEGRVGSIMEQKATLDRRVVLRRIDSISLRTSRK